MEGDNSKVPVFDKSFNKDSLDEERKKEWSLDTSENFNFRREDMIHLSEDDDLSCSLIPSINLQLKKFGELNFSNPSSNFLNIYDSLDLKFKSRPYFFRQLTKSHCEISCEEEKNLSEKIINYMKSGSVREILPQEKNPILESNNNTNKIIQNSPSSMPKNIGQNFPLLNITQEERQMNPIFNQGNLISVKEVDEEINSNKIDDSISEENFEKMLNTQMEKGFEIKIFRKNKQMFSNLNSINFNILIVGEKGTGKTQFIRKMKHKSKISVLKNEMKLEENSNKNNDCILDNSKNNLSLSEDLSIISDRKLRPTKNFTSNKIRFTIPRINSSANMDKINLQNLKVCNDVKENNYIYDINLIDSPGFSNEDNEDSKNEWLEDIKKYITNRNEDYFKAKESLNLIPGQDQTVSVQDCRIHLCIFFSSNPKVFEYNAMRDISNMTSIISVVTVGTKKSITKKEALEIKSKILEEGRNKYKINFMELDQAINKICHDPAKVNYLLGGKLGFCPPFIITIDSLLDFPNSNFEQIKVESTNSLNPLGMEIYENSDFSRLYYTITSFIPFECIERTKIYYKIFKKQKIKSLQEIENDNENESNKNYKNILKNLGVITSFGSLGCLIYLKNNYIKK